MKRRKAAMVVLSMGILLLLFLFHIEMADVGRHPLFDQTAGLKVMGFRQLGGLLFQSGKGAFEDAEKPKIAITFDDGPHPYYTEQLLDGLKERGVKATFFVVGEHAALHPDIIKRMSEEGHLIGNHTYSHIQLQPGNREKFREELEKTNSVLQEITGKEVYYVRPPYGTWDKELESELNMIPILWNVDPMDWCSDNVSGIVKKVVSKAKEGAIILMHDYYETSVTAALQIVDELQEAGYEFVTAEEIIMD